MSKAAAETAKQLFAGLSMDKFRGDVTAEAGRLFEQGKSEVAGALFSQGNAFVQYGAGQQPTNSHGVHGAEAQKEQPEHSNEGMSR
jgi:hypothetical protein